MPEKTLSIPGFVTLPAILQMKEQAPCFGTIVSIPNQDLAFNCVSTPPANDLAGLKTTLHFDFLSQHHACSCQIAGLHGTRLLLSLQAPSSASRAALRAVSEGKGMLAETSQSALQIQQTCHARFTHNMQEVVADFYRQLMSGQAESVIARQWGLNVLRNINYLQVALNKLRPELSLRLTKNYPMYPDANENFAASPTELALVDGEYMDDLVCRTTIARKNAELFWPMAKKFRFNYRKSLHDTHHRASHAYMPEAVLAVLSDFLAPLKLGPDANAFFYALMGQAFQHHAETIFQNMLDIVGDAPFEPEQPTQPTASLQQRLGSLYPQAAAVNEMAGVAATDRIASAADNNSLQALLNRVSGNLHIEDSRLSGDLQQNFDPPRDPAAARAPVPRLLAGNRVLDRFLAGSHAHANPVHARQHVQASTMPVGIATGADFTTLQSLQAMLQALPPLDLGLENLPPASQIRPFMLQAQDLLVKYSLSGLTYQSHPDHPAWTLVNELDALHEGADNHGQFLDASPYRVVSLGMQWLMEQNGDEASLLQANTLLSAINAQFHKDRQVRQSQYLGMLGTADADRMPIRSGWCVSRAGDQAIPYEILGKFNGAWAMLNRSGTELLNVPAEELERKLYEGEIEETESCSTPFLERIATATLTRSLDAVHAYTWQDKASGCLKRSALMDELERRLAHPVTEPPTFCALLEIPGMRAGMSRLSAAELEALQQQTGKILLEMRQDGEHCGRLSEISFLMIFRPQDANLLTRRISQLKQDIEELHPDWKLSGAVVPLVDEDEAQPSASSVLRRANLACAPQRQAAGLDLSNLSLGRRTNSRFSELPFSSLYLRGQKIASCHENGGFHYEVLLGLNDALMTHHTPQSFVVMAEQTGLISNLDLWVLQTALEWMEHNLTDQEQPGALSINLSGNSITSKEHVALISSLLARYPHLVHKIIFEVTETAAINNLDLAVRALRELRKLGCRVALDDFGSGYSSYAYLRRLPLDYLKIDGIYIRNILTDQTDQALTASMIEVGHALGLKVIAEYVETEETYAMLKELGVDYVQGYWIHKPESLSGLEIAYDCMENTAL